MKTLAIIPARSGSKRIPSKNIKDFCGKPVISYSIEAALNSGCFDEVMVSTDSGQIAKIAESFGAKVPFMRSEKNSDDYASTADVLIEVIEEYSKLGFNYDFACCIYPAAPFVTPEKLQKAFDLLQEKDINSVISVKKFCHPVQRAFKIEDIPKQKGFSDFKEHKLIEGSETSENRITNSLPTYYKILEYLYPENENMRSQDLMPTYHDSGQFYFFNVKSFLEQKTLVMKNTAPLVIPESQGWDIDTEEDWKIAEVLYKCIN